MMNVIHCNTLQPTVPMRSAARTAWYTEKETGSVFHSGPELGVSHESEGMGW